MAKALMSWRTCVRFPQYEISECGDMRRRTDLAINLPGLRLRGYIDHDGYLTYKVRAASGDRHQAFAHVMVAEAFNGLAPSPTHQVAHINGSRLLNTPENLTWKLPVGNQSDRVTHGTSAQGVGNGRAKITDDDVRYIRRRYPEIKASRGRLAELDERFGLSRNQIIRIARGQAWSHIA